MSAKQRKGRSGGGKKGPKNDARAKATTSATNGTAAAKPLSSSSSAPRDHRDSRNGEYFDFDLGADRKSNRERLVTPQDAKCALALFLLSLAVYLCNGFAVTTTTDATANLHLPLRMLRGSLTWSPHECPALFMWQNGETNEKIYFRSTVKGRPEGQNRTGHEILTSGIPLAVHNKYCLTRTERDPNRFANTFNLGAGATFAPVVAALALATGRGLNEQGLDAMQGDTLLLVRAGKVVASTLVAASVAIVYLTARAFPSVTIENALIAAMSLAFGTGVWSISSQALWQHPFNEFYLSVAIWALVQSRRRRPAGRGKLTKMKLAALCGFAVGMATMSRPTSAVFAISIGIYYLFVDRSIPNTLAYGGAGSILAFLQLYYNHYHFGSAFAFGQQEVGRTIAMQKTGKPDLWQTPLWRGAAMLLFSPNRGLFLFSPFVLFATPAMYFAFRALFSGRARNDPKRTKTKPRKRVVQASSETNERNNEFEVLRPLFVSVLLLWMVAFKFFDYWGGWCYGYRPLIDTMPILALGLSIVMDRIRAKPILWRLFWICVVWSVFVQFMGAFAFDLAGWNYREGVVFRAPPSDGGNGASTKGAILGWTFDREGVERLRLEHPNAIVSTESLDVDKPEYRERLWHFTDSQVWYYVTNFVESREHRAREYDWYVKYH